MDSTTNTPLRRLRLYGPSLITLAVLLPFFAYYVRQVKSQEAYLNDHSFRVLDVIAQRFTASINGGHGTMEASVLLPPQECNLRVESKTCKAGDFDRKDAQEQIQAYLSTYVVHGDVTVEEIKEPTVIGLEKHSISRAEDSQIYIQLLHENKVTGVRNGPMWLRITTRLYPERILARAVENQKSGMFETVFVATRNGQVLAQNSNSKVDVSQLQSLLDSRQVRAIVEGSKSPGGPGPTLTDAQSSEISGADQRFAVQVADTDYVLFGVPASLVLFDETGKETAMAIYGLIRKDDLDAKALQLPLLGMPAMGVAFFIGMAFLWPVLKLYTMSDRERLTKRSVAVMCGVTLIAALLLWALYLQVGFSLAQSERSDQQLRDLSARIQSNFSTEVRRGIDTSRSIMNKLLSRVGNDPNSMWPADSRFPISQLNDNSDFLRYPFFKHIILTGRKPAIDSTGGAPTERQIVKLSGGAPTERQIVKLSASTLPTPLIALTESGFPFVSRMERSPSRLGPDHFVIESFVSPNTGEFVPVLMFPRSAGSPFHIMVTTELPSLVNVIFPPGFGFSVIEEDGSVVFDSDTSRNLKENFFSECQDPTDLKEALRLNQEGLLDLTYSGGHIRAFVRPLAGGSTGEALSKLGLNLIVYYDKDRQAQTLFNIGRTFLAGVIGVPFPLLLFAVLVTLLVRAFRRPANITYIKKRVWPWEAEKPTYLAEGVWGLACFVIAVLMGLIVPPVWTPWVLDFFLVVCVGGFVHSLLDRNLVNSPRLTRLMARVPLSTAYAARIFGMGVGGLGILSILVYQLVLTNAQLGQDTDDYRTLASAIENRASRISEDFQAVWFHAGVDSEGPRKNPSVVNRADFCQARINDGFDVYDHRAIAGSKIFKGLASARQSLPIESVLLTVPPPSCEPDQGPPLDTQPMAFETGALWKALPDPFIKSRAGVEALSFYLLGLLLLLPIFLWLRLVIRRIFILDFIEPEPLPTINGRQLTFRMETALARTTGRMDRVLIFAHPQSGSGLVLEKVVTTLKKHKAIPEKFQIVDFGAPENSEGGNAARLRQRVVEASEDSRTVILDNFEVQITDPGKRAEKLAILEALISTHHSSIYVLTSSDPQLLMESLLRLGPYTDALQSEVDRWARVLGSFERFIFDDDTPRAGFLRAVSNIILEGATKPLSNDAARELPEIVRAELSPTIFLRRCAPHVDVKKLDFGSSRDFEESLVMQVRDLADAYYRVIWLNCTSDERLALYQLAMDDWLNPLNKVAISHLLRKQLIGKGTPSGALSTDDDFHYRPRDGAYRLMNLSFRSFVLETVSNRELALWEKQQNLSVWPALRTALVLALILVALFVAYVRRDIFDVYFSYFAALAGGGAALIRIVLQFFSKDDPKVASVFGVGSKTDGSDTA